MVGKMGEKELREVLQRVYAHTLKINDAMRIIMPHIGNNEKVIKDQPKVETLINKGTGQPILKREIIRIKDIVELETGDMVLYPIIDNRRGIDPAFFPPEFLDYEYGKDCNKATPAKVEWKNPKPILKDSNEVKNLIRAINQGDLRFTDVFFCLKKGRLFN